MGAFLLEEFYGHRNFANKSRARRLHGRNDIAPNRERSELVFRVPESVYDTPVAALDIDESTKSALQKQKITVLEHLMHRLAVGKNAAKQLHIAQDAAEQVVNAVIETAYRSLSEPEKRNFWERILHNTDGDAM